MGRLGLNFGLNRPSALDLAVSRCPADSGGANAYGLGSLLLSQVPFKLRGHTLHDAAATARTAGARGPIAHVFEVVVHRNLFAGLNRPQAHVNDMALHDAGHDVGFTAMVDDFSAAASERTIERPV